MATPTSPPPRPEGARHRHIGGQHQGACFESSNTPGMAIAILRSKLLVHFYDNHLQFL